MRLVEVEDVRVGGPVLGGDLITMLVDAEELFRNSIVLLPSITRGAGVVEELHFNRPSVRLRPHTIAEFPAFFFARRNGKVLDRSNFPHSVQVNDQAGAQSAFQVVSCFVDKRRGCRRRFIFDVHDFV